MRRHTFRVMLEGSVDQKTGFFITFEVVALSAAEAEKIALAGLEPEDRSDARLEEIEELGLSRYRSSRVLQRYGRAYFPLDS